MKKSMLKSEKHPILQRKLLDKAPIEIKRNSRDQDSMLPKEDKMSRREYRLDLKNSRKPKRNDGS